jgi:hypothetical protein
MIGLEMAVIKSGERVFPNCEIKGCFFHLSQKIYRKIQDSGLQQHSQIDRDFALKLRMLPVLACVAMKTLVKPLTHIIPRSQIFIIF